MTAAKIDVQPYIRVGDTKFVLRQVEQVTGIQTYEATIALPSLIDTETTLIVRGLAGGIWRASVEQFLAYHPAKEAVEWLVGTGDTPEAAGAAALAVKLQGMKAFGHVWLAASTGHAATLDGPGEILQVIPADAADLVTWRGTQPPKAWCWTRTWPTLDGLAGLLAGAASPALLRGSCDSRDEAMRQATWAKVTASAAIAEAARACGMRILRPAS